MSAPLVVNTTDGTVWTRRTVTRGGLALYAVAGVCDCPELVMATLSELAERGIAGSADVLPMPVGPEQADRAKVPIVVRVTLDAYDFAHPGEKQTAVHVQIPEVGRVTYMLPAERYAGLKDREWPEVLDVAHEHYERGWVVTDSASATARAAITAWLRDDTNRDEMQAAWELDQVRQHPVTRKLHAENERLRARVAELEAERHSTNEVLSDAMVERTADRWTAFFAPTQVLGLESGGGE